MFDYSSYFAAAMSFLGGERQNAANKEMAEGANQTNIMLSREARDWAASMSNTAYQRATADMKAAGLNPALAGLNRTPASTPNAPVATVNPARFEDSIGKGVSSALMASELARANRNTDSQVQLNEAAAEEKRTGSLANVSTAKAADAQATKAAADTKATEISNQKEIADLPAARQRALLSEKTAAIDTKAAWFDAISNRAVGVVGGLSNALGQFLRPKSMSTPGDTTKRVDRIENHLRRTPNKRPPMGD